MTMPTLVKTAYAGWPSCYWLNNGRIELVITGDVGPRLIRFGFVGGENMLYEDAAARGLMGGGKWQLYGGHRLWHAPEHPVRTYIPDNSPVDVVEFAGGVRITPPEETANGVQKQIDVFMDERAARVRLVHRLTNTGAWPVKLTAWALTVMAPGGTAIVPLPPRGEHPRDLLPSSQLVLWPYTDMADPRWTWGSRFVLLRQRPGAPPQKAGFTVPDGWMAYSRGNELFVKRFEQQSGVEYPDMNSSVEMFTDGSFLELETLSPITELAPGQSIEHEEQWALFEGTAAPNSDAEVERNVLPLVEQALK